MKNTVSSVSIPKACHESWDAMTLAEQGRFCQNCQKTVTDFSGMSDQEIISFFSNRQDNICGRFHPTQLNRALEQPIVNKRSRKPFAAIMTLFTALTISIPSVKAQKKAGKVYVAPEEKPKKDTTITDADSTGFIRMEIFFLGVARKYSIRKIEVPSIDRQPVNSNFTAVMGAVIPGVKIEMKKDTIWETVKTSIVDFF